MKPKRREEPLRPRDLALLLLASGDMLPRQRARDQQADRAGLELKRRLLQRLMALDPQPAEIDAALQQSVAEMEPPHGPARAIAQNIREEWQAACNTPELIRHLLHEAMRSSGTGSEDKQRDQRRSSQDR